MCQPFHTLTDTPCPTERKLSNPAIYVHRHMRAHSLFQKMWECLKRSHELTSQKFDQFRYVKNSDPGDKASLKHMRDLYPILIKNRHLVVDPSCTNTKTTGFESLWNLGSCKVHRIMRTQLQQPHVVLVPASHKSKNTTKEWTHLVLLLEMFLLKKSSWIHTITGFLRIMLIPTGYIQGF